MKKRFLSLFLAVLMVLLPALPVSAAEATANVTISGTENYDEIQQILLLVNEARTAEGLNPLTLDTTLTAYAMQRAAECTVYYSHTRPNGSSCFTLLEGNFQFGGAGENIAMGQRNAQAVHTAWMNSQGHRENIMNPSYQSVGIGCFYQDGYIAWAQMFSTRSSTNVCQTSGIVQRDHVPISVAREYLSPYAIGMDTQGVVFLLYQGAPTPVCVYLNNLGWEYATPVRLSGGYSFSGVTTGASTQVPGAVEVTVQSTGTVQLTLTMDGGLETSLEAKVAKRPVLRYTDSGSKRTISYEDEWNLAQLYVQVGGSGPWTPLGRIGQTSYVHSQVSEEETYTYVLKAKANGCEIEVSDRLVIGAPPEPEEPEVPDIPVEPGAPGNVDGNAYLNENDAIYLLQHVLMPDLFQINQDADFDKNGTVNEDDAIYLLQHILMPNLFPL